MKQAVSHYKHIDFLRASAVMLVFVAHFVESIGSTTSTGLGSAAHFGVLMFFVHTSLVLFMSMERMRPQRFFSQFYIRRVFRIYPLAIVAVLFMIATGLPPAKWLHPLHPAGADIVANLLLVQNLTGGPDILATMWSLPFEVQMYAALPFLFLLRKRINAVVLWALALSASEVLLASNSHAGEILRYVPCFCGGMVAYRLLREELSFRIRFRFMPPALAAAVAVFVTVGHFIGFTAAADAVGALAVGALTGMVDGVVPSAPARVCEEIAKYSYGIYLSHVPIMMMCFGSGVSPIRLAAFAVLTIAVPVVLFHGIEKPMIAVGKRLSDSIVPRTDERAVMAKALPDRT